TRSLFMAEIESPYCPECDEAFDFPEPPAIARRDFLRGAAGAAAALSLGAVAIDKVAAVAPRVRRPAEDLVRELHSTLTADQKRRVVLPYNHGAAANRRPTRQGMYNAPIQNIRIDQVYTRAQIDLIERIVRSMSSGEEGWRQISRLG